MSKIDLSKAKIGDKFRTRAGYVVELKDIVQYLGDDVYRLTSPKVVVCVFQNGKIYKDNRASEFDLVEQVFDDEKDTTDLLQRRQEVVKVANELFTRGTMKDWFYELLQNNKIKTTYVEYIFTYAKEFVSTREKYLKEGKL